MSLFMWKESIGAYRFQTDDPVLNRKMKGRRTFNLIAEGVGCKIWIYRVLLDSVQAAKSRFKGLTGKNPNYINTEDVYCAE